MKKTLISLALLAATLGCVHITLAETAVPSQFKIIGDWKLRVTSAKGKGFDYEVTPPKPVAVRGERQRILAWNAKGSGWKRGYCPAKIRLMECTAENALDVSSVVVRDAHGKLMKRGTDYEIEERWGAIGALGSSALKGGDEVAIDYDYYLPQAVKIEKDGRFYGSVYLTRTMKRLDEEALFPFVEGPEKRPHGELGAAKAKCPKTWAKLERGEKVRILAWGDSVTEMGYLPNACKWQVRFVKALRAKFPKAQIELVENGWSGRCAKTFLNAPASDAKHHFATTVVGVKADLVVSEFINDASLYGAKAKAQFTADYTKILSDFRAAGSEWIIVAPHFSTPSWMHSKTMKFSADTRPFVAYLREFAAKNNLALADTPLIWGHLHLEGVPYQPIFMNGINHPNAEGLGYFVDALMALF